MKLTEKQLDVLACIHLQAQNSVELISTQTGYKQTTIRNCIRTLLDNKIIAKRVIIDVYPLGFHEYWVYFSLNRISKELKQKLIIFLKKSVSVSSIFKIGGDFNYAVAICVTNPRSVHDFLKVLNKKVGDVLHDKVIVVRLSCAVFHRKYLTSKKFSVPAVCYGSSDKIVTVDDIDRKIISHLMISDSDTRRELSRNTGIPMNTINYRIRQLEKKGLISGYVYQVFPAVLNVEIFVLLINTKGLSVDLTRRLYKFAEKHPNIINFTTTLGSWDYEFFIECKDYSVASSVVEKFSEVFESELNATTLLPVFGYEKVATYPLDVEEERNLTC